VGSDWPQNSAAQGKGGLAKVPAPKFGTESPMTGPRKSSSPKKTSPRANGKRKKNPSPATGKGAPDMPGTLGVLKVGKKVDNRGKTCKNSGYKRKPPVIARDLRKGGETGLFKRPWEPRGGPRPTKPSTHGEKGKKERGKKKVKTRARNHRKGASKLAPH